MFRALTLSMARSLHTIMYLVAVKDRAEVDRVYYRAEHHPIDE